MNKKKLIAFAAAASLLASISLASCNRQVFDFNYNFDRAIIKLADGTVISGKCESWRDYDGEQMQIKINGVTYLVHAANLTLIDE